MSPVVWIVIALIWTAVCLGMGIYLGMHYEGDK